MGRYVYSYSAVVEFPSMLCPPIENCGSFLDIFNNFNILTWKILKNNIILIKKYF